MPAFYSPTSIFYPKKCFSPVFRKWSESCPVMSNCLSSHVLYSPWNSPGQNTGVGSLCLLQGIFPTQGSNSGLPHCRRILYQLSHKGSLYLETKGENNIWKSKKKIKSYETVLELESGDQCMLCYVLKATDLYPLEELALRYVYNILINLFSKKQ